MVKSSQVYRKVARQGHLAAEQAAMFVTNRISGLFRDKRGNVSILFALAIIPVMGLVGASVDYSNAVRVRQKITQTIDAAALAAGSAIDLSTEERKALAQNYMDANFNSIPGLSLGEANVAITDSAITITISGSLQTAMLGLMGYPSLTVAANTEVMVKNTKLELALVLDTTGSMDGSKISTLKTAVNTLVETLYTTDGSTENIKVGIVPFNTHVNIGTGYKDEAWLDIQISEVCSGWGWYKTCYTPEWQGCVHRRSGTYHTNETDVTSEHPVPGVRCGVFGHPYYYDQSYKAEELQPLTNSKTTLDNKVAALTAEGGTYIPIGLSWGWKILSPNVPYTDVAAYSDKQWTKAMIVMTDGQNQPIEGTADEANTNTATLCTNIKNAGISVYTVAFQISDTATKSMMQACASKPSYYYDATNNAALLAAFSSITEQLSELRLSK